MEKLQNKDVRTLHNELKTEHTKHTEGLLYNGELREAAKVVAKNTLDALKKQWQNILDSDCDSATKKKLETKQWALVNEIITYTNTIANTEYLFSHDKHLNQLAQRIDNAENEIAGIIEEIWRKQELQATKEAIGTKYFKELPKWWLQLTAATNAPRIDQVLGKLIQPNKVWKIDYSGCTNEKWKNTMIQAMGWLSSGYISQGIDSQWNNTFVIKGLDWKQINQRAIIREWVTLYPSEAIVDESIKEQQNKTNKLKNIDVATKLKQASELWKYPWLAKALWNKTEKFITLAEEKLHNTIVYAKKHGWELHSEPITKKWLTEWQLLQVHLVNKTWEKDLGLLTKPMDSEIYEILDDNESDLVQYMTARLKQKWNEYGHLDKVNTVAVWMQEKGKQTTMLNDTQKVQVKNGLQWLTTMVNNMIDAEGDTKLWTRDEKLRALSSYLRDVTAAVVVWKKMTEYDVDKFSAQIATLYKKAYNLDDTMTNRNWIVTQLYDTKKDVKTILLWTPQQSADAMRLIAERSTYGSNTHTSFLADDIANVTKVNDNNQTESTMKIEKTTYNDCFKRIETLLWTNNPWSIAKIDEMYALWSAKDLFDWFVKNWLLPKNAEFKNPLMRDGWPKSRTEAIFNQLKATKEQLADVDGITANARKGRAEEKRALESKWMLSDNEMQQLQVLHVLELHPDKANEAIQGILTSMKYQSVANLVRGQLTPWLVKEWGWVEWQNADTYNDIVWAWWLLDFSDTNAVAAQWMMVMMVEEIWSIVVAGVLIASWAWAPAWAALLATKVGKRWTRVVKVVNTYVKNTKVVKSLSKYLVKPVSKITDKTTLTRAWKKVVQWMTQWKNIATAWLAQGMPAGERSIKDGWIDYQIDAFTLWMVQKLGMISVLQSVTSSAATGTLSRVFAKMPDWKLKVAKQISAQVFFEEIWMAGTDFTSSLMLSNQPFTMKELADNLLLGVVFEAIPWVKKVVLYPGGLDINWRKLTIPEAKAELDKKLSSPDVKKAVEAKMKQYESKSPQTTRQKYQEALERDNAEISRIRYETRWLEKQRSVLYDKLVKNPNNKRIEQEIKDIEAHIYRNEAALKYLEESSLRMHDKSKKFYDEKSLNQTHGTEAAKKIKEQMERETKQWKYAWELATWMLMVEKLPNAWLPDAIKKLKSHDWFWKDDVIALQKELWLTGKDVDGIFWPKTLKKLEAYLQDLNRITKEDLLITKDILREEAIKNWIGDKKAFFAEAKVNGGIITLDGVEYRVKQWKDRVEIATAWVWWWKKPLSDAQKSDLFDRYQQQKVEEFVNNHPDVKNAKIIDEAVVNNKESKPKVEQSIASSEKQLTEITIDWLTIPPAVVTYFKNNPISESVAKKLTPEDISNIDAYLTDAMYKDWYQGATREQMIQNYLRDVVAKRADVSSRVEAKQSVEAKAWESVKAVESSWSQNPFDFAKSADAIAAQAFKEIPANETLAKSRVEQFGEWLWKNAIWPTLKFMTDAIKWLKKIEFKFPSLKNKIAKISKKLESMRINRSVEKINALKWKSSQEKIAFVEKFDMDKASNQELIALYKMMGWQWDPFDWAVVALKDWTNTLQTRLKSEITDHVDKMRLEIKKQPQRIEHNFVKSPELKVSNQEVVLSLKEWEQYSVFMWRTECKLYKNGYWDIMFVSPWNPPKQVRLEIGKEYKIWRNHTELTGKLQDLTISRDHAVIKIDKNGNVLVRDLKSKNQTVLRKVGNKNLMSLYGEADYIKWSKQAEIYNKSSEESSFKMEIDNWFVDWWRGALFFASELEAKQYIRQTNSSKKVVKIDDWVWWVSSREFIVVDRKNDPLLQWMIKAVTKIKHLPLEQRVTELASMCYKWTKHWNVKQSELLSWSMRLWEIINKWGAVCRHRSLLFHILAKEVGIESGIRKWYIYPEGWHAWNEVKINWTRKVIDITYVVNRKPHDIVDYSKLDNYWFYNKKSGIFELIKDNISLNW